MCEKMYVTNKEFDLVLLESICLQMRKILELVAMSSLISNKDAFDITSSKIFNQWRGKEIIKEIKSYSNLVFPKISYEYFKFSPNDYINNFTNFKEITTNLIDEDKFCQIYDKCSELLHIKNPYSQSNNIQEKIDYISMNIGTWLDYIFNTYSLCKIVPFGNEDTSYVVYMGNLIDDTTVHVWPGFRFP